MLTSIRFFYLTVLITDSSSNIAVVKQQIEFFGLL